MWYCHQHIFATFSLKKLTILTSLFIDICLGKMLAMCLRFGVQKSTGNKSQLEISRKYSVGCMIGENSNIVFFNIFKFVRNMWKCGTLQKMLEKGTLCRLEVVSRLGKAPQEYRRTDSTCLLTRCCLHLVQSFGKQRSWWKDSCHCGTWSWEAGPTGLRTASPWRHASSPWDDSQATGGWWAGTQPLTPP